LLLLLFRLLFVPLLPLYLAKKSHGLILLLWSGEVVNLIIFVMLLAVYEYRILKGHTRVRGWSEGSGDWGDNVFLLRMMCWGFSVNKPRTARNTNKWNHHEQSERASKS